MRQLTDTRQLENIEDTMSDEEKLIRLADNMAAAAIGFSCQGYDTFIEARDEFRRMTYSIIGRRA